MSKQYIDPVNQKTVLITGASSGLGYAFVKYFALHGYSVVMVANDKPKLEAAAESIRKLCSSTILSISLDLSQPNSARVLYDLIRKKDVCIDILINNAGFGSAGAFSEIDYTKEEDEMTLNMITLTLLTKLFLVDMLKRDSGMILNIASLAATTPGPFMAVYYATKAYVLHFSEALSEEVKNTGVTVSVFCPGPTKTNFAATAGVTKSKLFSRDLPNADMAVKTAIKGLIKSKRTIFDNSRNHAMAIMLRFISKKSALKITSRVNRS
ncbi:MAG: SDR family NAD(P)-dependent oxidoreductase [Candidatus Saccharimonadales bacterium]